MEKLIIIGSGPAGLCAAIYAARGELQPVVITGNTPGGQPTLTTDVDDYPGFPEGIKGPELTQLFLRQAEKFGTRFVKEEVKSVDFSKTPFEIKTESKALTSLSVIIATGSSPVWLNLPSEKKLLGRGVSACAVCVTPDTQIITNPSVTPITTIQEPKGVLTHKGRFQPTLVTGNRHYKGRMTVINSSFFYGELKLTPEHEILAAKRIKGYYHQKFLLRQKYKEGVGSCLSELGLSPGWIPAGSLDKGDFLFYPILQEIKDISEINLCNYVDCQKIGDFVANHKSTHTSVKIPKTIKVDKNLLRLCGYYISEGSGGKQLDIYFHKGEINYINDVRDLIKNIFGVNVHIKTSGSVTHIQCFSKLVGEFFKNTFGCLSEEKHLPHWILNLPVDKQAELFKGVWRGDGSSKRKSFHYVTSSKVLSEQLKVILLRMGTIPNTFIKTVEHQNRVAHKIKGRDIIAKHDKYEIEIGGPWVGIVAKYLGIEHPMQESRKRTNYFGWFQEEYAVIPIRNIRQERYDGMVYNLTVENDNSYTTTNACVHNCDGPFFKGKKVAIIGGGDSAMKEAVYLSKIAAEVIVVHRRDQLRAQEVLQKQAKAKDNIKFIFNSEVVEILGDEKVTGLKLKNIATEELTKLEVDGVFVAIGHKPATGFLKGQVELDVKDFVVKHGKTETSVPGVFVAGDVADSIYRQIVTAAGSGAQAALDVESYLDNLN